MNVSRLRAVHGALCLAFIMALSGHAQERIPFVCSPLTEQTDFSSKMVAGVDRFLTRETDRCITGIPSFWKRDFSSPESFGRSISASRTLLSLRTGVAEERVSPQMDILTNFETRGLGPFRLEMTGCTISAVRWKVLDGLSAEGLLLQPRGQTRARVVLIPDADVVPEVLAGLKQMPDAGYGVAQRLANAGYEVLVPVIISRDDRYSGNKSLGLYTNQPHREWIYRQAYEVGRHVIGYELQKVFSAIDWMEAQNKLERKALPIGVAGHGEGGLLAMYASALDTRISCTLVSGYFDGREQVWKEPIYRNVFGMLKQFGDAEIAVMSWPRVLIVEYARGPELKGPPPEINSSGEPAPGRSGAAPGQLTTPLMEHARAEWIRAKEMVPAGRNPRQWVSSRNGPFAEQAIQAFCQALHATIPNRSKVPIVHPPLKANQWLDPEQRQERSVREMEAHIQRVAALCHRTRDRNFWELLTGDTLSQQPVKAALRKQLGEVLGSLPIPSIPANPKARQIAETDRWTSYELTLDVYAPDVFAWGILMIPKGMQPGEKRPVVVCQHGLEGLPEDLLSTDTASEAYYFYKSLGLKLASKGYIVFIPHNFYKGGNKFRVLQRKANPIGLTLFSVITAQHRRIVEWLGQQSFVDASKIGFYGLSYGGKTAMRVPALVEGYALSICSADFNEWIVKNTTVDYPFGYLYTEEYDMPEWDLGHTFSYAEMAALIAPRPFMVERGHMDGVSIDELVDFEFARVRRHYDALGIPQRTRIEHFNGPHGIHGVGTFEFLDIFLREGRH